MKRSTLSVVIPNYNHARFIPDALGAILSQSRRPDEILIIDDASTDDSVAVLERFAASEPGLIRVIRNDRNRGVVYTIRRLMDLATGDYVYSGACDDMLLPGFFERSMHLLEGNPAAGLCSTLSAIMSETGEYEGVVRHPIVRAKPSYLSPHEVLTELRRQPSWFMGSTIVFRRQALLDAGGFIQELGPYCDGFISLVLGLKHGACFIPEPLGVWRRMAGTYSTLVGSDIDATVRIIETAERLMRSTYRDQFPDDYIAEWKSEMYFGAASGYVGRTLDLSIEQLERLIPNGTRLDSTFLRAMGRTPALGRLAKLYLLLRMRPAHIGRTAWRQLVYRFHPHLRRPVDLTDVGLSGTRRLALLEKQ